MLYLKNKLPVTNVQIKKHDIPVADNFRHYYETTEFLLENFLQRTEKTAWQFIKDINDVWSTVDPNMALYPNQLRDPENIEIMFFLPMRHKLEENKDKDPHVQTDHIQAKTIKSKLQSLIRLTYFLRDRRIFVGLNRQELLDLT